jgi:3'-5' exoribonuclease
MAQPRPALTRLSELTVGQKGDFFALLAEKPRRVTRQGKPYYHCRFRDAGRVVSFLAWGDEDSPWYLPCEREWRPGQFYKLRATYLEHEKYGPHVEIHNIRPVTDADRADGFDAAQFVESSRHDIAAMFADLRTIATKHIGDEPLRKLVLALLDRHAAAFQRLPASRDRAYPFRGGLLEHTLSVVRVAVDLAERYADAYPELSPPLNGDLVAAGAILHDIGRVLELGEEVPAPAVTVPGRLVGAPVLGRDLVREAAREVEGLEPELVRLLEHILLTGLPSAEAAGVQPALIPEGLIVHYADDLDLKMEQYARLLGRDQSPGPFTDRDPFLGRHLLKERGV